MTHPTPNGNTKGKPILNRWVPIMEVYSARVRRGPTNTLLQSEPGMPVLHRSTPKKGAITTH
jgi:hypothetical protein